MNELQVVNKAIAEINQRAEYLKTKEGKAETSMRFIEIFAVFQGYGYRLPDVDKKLMAQIWTEALKEYVSLYGINTVKRAVIHFVTHDDREYKSFPKPVELINAIQEVGGEDPRKVRARIKHEELKKRLREESEKKLQEVWDKKTPEEKQIALERIERWKNEPSSIDWQNSK